MTTPTLHEIVRMPYTRGVQALSRIDAANLQNEHAGRMARAAEVLSGEECFVVRCISVFDAVATWYAVISCTDCNGDRSCMCLSCNGAGTEGMTFTSNIECTEASCEFDGEAAAEYIGAIGGVDLHLWTLVFP